MRDRRRNRRLESSPRTVWPWMITYADMMSLLLAFFVMLFAFSEIKEEKFRKVRKSFQRYFGYEAGLEGLPTPEERAAVLLERLRTRIDLRVGTAGENLFVTTMPEGLKITVAGKLLFSEAQAEITDEGKKILGELAPMIKGYNNRIEIRGHSSRAPLPEDSPYADHWELSWRRALNVEKYLVELGVSEHIFKISAMSKYDPIDENIKESGRILNRRVELIVSEEIVLP